MDYGVLLTKRLVQPRPEPLGAMLLRKVHKTDLELLAEWLVDELAKGDEEGHDFHGNQYTGGIGGGGEHNTENEPKEKSTYPGGVKNHVHDLLASGKSFSIKELAAATGAKEDRVKFLISRLQNPKYAAAGKPALTLEKTPDGKYKVVGTKENANQSKAPGTPKPVAAPKPPGAEKPAANPKPTLGHPLGVGGSKPPESTHVAGTSPSAVGHGITEDHFGSKSGESFGKFANENSRLNELIKADEGKSPQEWKDKVSKEVTARLQGDKDWQAVAGSSKFGGERGLAAALISVWAGTSGDHEPIAQAMQLAARDEYGLHSAELGHMGFGKNTTEESAWKNAYTRVFDGVNKNGPTVTWNPTTKDYDTKYLKPPPSMDTFKAAMRAYTRAEYANTQKWFADKGIKEVAVFRGMKNSSNTAPTLMTLNGQPLSSFSTSLSVAQRFGSHIHMAVFPVSQVVGSCKTGRGCFSERELVVMGKPTRVVRAGKSHVNSFIDVDKVGKQAFHKGKG